MKLRRMKTLGMFGIGFLAGSRAGRGPWEKAQAGVGQLKDKMNGGVPPAQGAPNGQRASVKSPMVTQL